MEKNKLTYSQLENIINKFLSTLDKLKITTDNSQGINYIGTESLTEYWLKNGAEYDGR